MVAQMLRHRDDVGDLLGRVTLVHVPERLVVDVLDGVAVIGQQRLDPVRALDRAAVMRHQGLRAELLQPVEAARPRHRVAKARAAQRVDVGKGFVDRVRREQHLEIGQPHRALVLGLGRDEMDLVAHPAGLAAVGLLERDRGRDEGAPARALRRAEPGADRAVLADREPHAELVHRAPAEDRSDQPHVARHVMDQVPLADDVHPAGGDLFGVDERGGAAHVVGVEMGIDDRPDRLVGNLAELRRHRLRVVHPGHGVDQDAGILAFDQGAVDDGIGVGAVDRALEGVDPGLHRGLVAREVRVDRRGDLVHGTPFRPAGRAARRVS